MKLLKEGRYLLLAEANELLSKEEEPKEVHKLALEHAKTFSKLSVKEAKELADELSKLDLPENIICKLVDILPSDKDTVITILSTDKSRIQENLISRVLETVLKYVKE
jgi:DNA-directed RNA polymerase subunit F